MTTISMTYGVLPTEEQFNAQWEALEAEGGLEGGKFRFGNDWRVGNCSYTQSDLWFAINKAFEEYTNEYADDRSYTERLGTWISDVLGCLHVEWI